MSKHELMDPPQAVLNRRGKQVVHASWLGDQIVGWVRITRGCAFLTVEEVR